MVVDNEDIIDKKGHTIEIEVYPGLYLVTT